MEIKRDFHLKRLIDSRHNGMIKVVTGIRRCGKSYLLFKLFRDYLKNEGIKDDHLIMVDLEDRHNMELRDPDKLLKYIDNQMKDSDMYYILLDEIQLVSEFEDVLNSYLKVENADVYVTGSNSKFLSKDVITEFRGRGWEIKITPLSFREFVSVYNGTRESALKEYLVYGGLPKLLSFNDDTQKTEYLKGLFAKTYLTDIKERYRIKQDAELEELMDVIASTIGGLTNPQKLENTFKTVKNVQFSKQTIKTYLDILEEVFLIEKSIRYDIKGKRYEATVRIFSQIMFIAPQIRLSEEQVRGGGKSYTYYYVVESSQPFIKAGHASELPVVFAHPEIQEFTGRAYDETFSKTMRKMWVQFAKTGNPSLSAEISPDGKAKEWPLYDLDNKQIMIFDEFNIHPEKESQRKMVDWEKTYFLTKYYCI